MVTEWTIIAALVLVGIGAAIGLAIATFYVKAEESEADLMIGWYTILAFISFVAIVWARLGCAVWIAFGILAGLLIAALLLGVRLDLNGRGDTEDVDE